jgi:GWxTD domain-containing protein
MTFIQLLVRTHAAKALGWTLLHSVWEGAVIALTLTIALAFLRSSRTRYAAGCLAMLSLLVAFGLTFAFLLPQPTQPAATAKILALSHPDDPWLGAKNSTDFRPLDSLPWLAPFWIAGVLVFHMRTLAGWMSAQRLRTTGVCSAPEMWQQRLHDLGARVRLSRPVILLESCLTDTPVVIGCFRPVILAPVGLLAGFPSEQVESILLHELAHILRHDYLINLLQSCVESLWFYHPAAWWISRVIRSERENCCDDLVVATHGDPRQYAAALVSLEEARRAVRQPLLAATGGGLVRRIRRLLYPPEQPRTALTPILSAGVLTMAAAMLLTGWPTQAPPPNTNTFPYKKWLNEDVTYIITDPERAAFQRLTTDAERDHFIQQFWERRDPTPGTEENEFKAEHYRRLAFANSHFTAGLPGWKTDRGRMYIQYGAPDEIESHPAGGGYQRPAAEGGGETSTYPFEDWRYRFIEGVGTNVIIEFVDKTGSGDYRMTTDPHAKENPQNGARFVAPPQGQPSRYFISKDAGAKATLEITADHQMRVTVPIVFDARQYSITGTLRSSDWRTSRTEFTAVVSLCKNSPGAPGCLEQPVLQVGPWMTDKALLDPGSYVFTAIVQDLAGPAEKTYVVDFVIR